MVDNNDPRDITRRRTYEVKTILPTIVNLNEVLKIDMRNNKVEFSSVRKNPLVRSYWQDMYNKLSNTILEYQTKLDLKQKELSSSSFTLWKPIPPEGYMTFGDILLKGHDKPMLSDIKCIPERCSKETRNC